MYPSCLPHFDVYRYINDYLTRTYRWQTFAHVAALTRKTAMFELRNCIFVNPVAGIFELPLKNFAMFLMVTITFSEKR